MNTLETKFTQSGFTHKQLKRVNDNAIYKRWKHGEENSHYEVVRIGRHNGYNLGGQYVAPAETYPGGSLWGIQGWTYRTIEEAEEKFVKVMKESGTKVNHKTK